MKLKALKTNLAKAEQGIWVENIPDMDDLRLRVRPAGNPDYRRVYGELVDALPRTQKRGGIVTDHKLKADISSRAMAATVLVGWDNFEGDDGQPLPYDPAVAKSMLLDPEYAAFRDAVAWAAAVAGEEVLGAADDKAGN